MSHDRTRIGGRLLGEFAVIVIGLLVAFAADRWITRVDEGRLADAYLESLQRDLAQDVAAFEYAAGFTRSNVLRVGTLLSVLRDGPTASTDRTEVLVAVEVLSWWTPVHYATGTWTDLTGSGNLRLIDSGLRSLLSRYYDASGAVAQFETVKNQGPFARYESQVSKLLSPEQRWMATGVYFPRDEGLMEYLWGGTDPVVEAGIDVSVESALSDAQFTALIERIQSTPDLEALLADLLIGSMGLFTHYNMRLKEAQSILEDVRSVGAPEVPREEPVDIEAD